MTTLSDPPEMISKPALVEIIKAATLDVFTTMLSLPIVAGEMRTEPTSAMSPKSGIVSLIGVAGVWAGTGCLACSGALACRLSSLFLMTPFETVNEDVLDALGEITNMIVGGVKTSLEEMAGPMGLSTPTVIYGRNFQTRSARVHEWTVVPFDCEGETLWVQMCLAPNKESRGTLRAGFQVPQVLNI
jgi:chemotaxis protein CheX